MLHLSKIKMLGDKSDLFYGARLVADARLHLGTVINGEASEVFFVTMCKIIDEKVYLGYRTFTNKEIKLSGAKDFLFNVSYGLGIKRITLATFLANSAKAAVKDKTQQQCAVRFARWLAEQHEGFDFPQEFFEYLRIKYYLKKKYKNTNRDKYRRLYLLDKVYNQYPHLLEQVGADKKYKDIFDCAQDIGIWERKKKLRPISLYINPTADQVRRLAEDLSLRLDRFERRTLIARLIEIYKQEAVDNGDQCDADA